MRGDLRFFLDRGMGSRIVPEGLRDAGWNITTMDERYGVASSQHVADIDWIRDASEAGEVLIAKDRAIAKRPLEAEALALHRARVFILASANITGTQMLDRLIGNADAIERAAAVRGPIVWGVDVGRLHRIRLLADVDDAI